VVLNNAVQIAHIEVSLEPRDDYARFRAELRTRSGKDVLAVSDLPRRRRGEGHIVSMDVPASSLFEGEYELALKGLRNGASQDVGYYYFRVRKTSTQ
jgi:hypothetical protein